MPEFLTVLPPDEALAKLFAHLPVNPPTEIISTAQALNRITAEEIRSPESLPAFPRSTMDGYAVRAQDTFGASQSLPAYLTVVGEVPMGGAPTFNLHPTQAALIHTGGMIPNGADAVVQIEVTQKSQADEIEVLKAVAPGENVLQPGDDVADGQTLFPRGHLLRPQDLGGLAALGFTRVAVGRRPRIALLATGDEVVDPDSPVGPGQVRDINSFSVSGLIERAGGVAVRRGIASDNFESLRSAAESALAECDGLVLSAGSSVSVRDMTADVINGLGRPGMLVHGVAVKPGKPAILAVANGKPVIGLPGNPVSALVIADLFVVPMIYRLQGCTTTPARSSIRAKISHNLPSATGRVDYTPARLVWKDGEQWAEPVFGKSNQIFTLVFADGMIMTPRDSNGLSAGEMVEVRLF
jgi:molybdopterin molybdotransferase